MTSDADRSPLARRIAAPVRGTKWPEKSAGAAPSGAPGHGTRIWIHDDLAERHPARALTRAFVAQGAVVGHSGKFSHLNDFPRTAADRMACEIALTELLDWEPNVVLAMRPGSLPPDLHRKIRDRGCRTVAWYSDGAVYYNSVYGEYARMYDVVLHTGGRANQEHYLQDLHISNGVEFPFFTDAIEHPTVAAPREPVDGEERRALFLGNTHDGARSDRSAYLHAMRDQVLHLGRKALSTGTSHPDEMMIDHRYEMEAVASLVDAGLNLSQQMSTYSGTRHDSVATRTGAAFPFPSRVAQYLSSGLPVLSRDLDPLIAEIAPEIIHVPGPSDALDVLTHGLTPDLYAAAARRARATFDAWGRAELLLRLLEEDGWRLWDTKDRCMAFADVSTPPGDAAAPRIPDRPSRLRDRVRSVVRGITDPAPEGPPRSRVILTGTGWMDTASDLQVAARALRRTGHEVIELNPHAHPGRVLTDSTGNFSLRINVDSLAGDAILVAGDTVDLTVTDRTLPCAHFVTRSSSPSILDRRRADHLQTLFTISPETADELRRSTGTDAYAIGALFDMDRRDSLRTSLERSTRPTTSHALRTLTIFRERDADLDLYAPWLSAADGFLTHSAAPSALLAADDGDVELARLLSVDAVLHVPDSSGTNPRASVSLAWAALGPGVDFVPRIPRPVMHQTEAAAVSVGSAKELNWKSRLHADPAVWHSHRRHVSSTMNAYAPETVLSQWLRNTLDRALS